MEAGRYLGSAGNGVTELGCDLEQQLYLLLIVSVLCGGIIYKGEGDLASTF